MFLLAPVSALGVSLKITFTADGSLAKPHEVVRTDGAAITPQSLRSGLRPWRRCRNAAPYRAISHLLGMKSITTANATAVIDRLPTAVLVVDELMSLLQANTAAEDMLDRKESVLAGPMAV